MKIGEEVWNVRVPNLEHIAHNTFMLYIVQSNYIKFKILNFLISKTN